MIQSLFYNECIFKNNNDINNNYHVISNDLKSESKEENFFEQDIEDKIKVNLEITLYPKMVRPMKNLQASYNKTINRIVVQAKQDKAALENLNFLINVAIIAMVAEEKVTKKVKEKFQRSMEPSKDSDGESAGRQLKKNFGT